MTSLKMADTSECCYLEYPVVEPIFDGNAVKLPFLLKDYVCPRTFVSFIGEGENYNCPQLVGWIITATIMGQVKVNLFHAPLADDIIFTSTFNPLKDMDRLGEMHFTNKIEGSSYIKRWVDCRSKEFFHQYHQLLSKNSFQTITAPNASCNFFWQSLSSIFWKIFSHASIWMVDMAVEILFGDETKFCHGGPFLFIELKFVVIKWFFCSCIALHHPTIPLDYWSGL